MEEYELEQKIEIEFRYYNKKITFQAMKMKK